ncbi:MAG: DUF4446 family protein [Armatimonadota bacterium]
MHWLTQLTSSISKDLQTFTLGAILALGILLLVVVYLIASVVSLKKRYNFLLRHEQTQDLGDVFSDHQKRIENLESREMDNREKVTLVGKALQASLQRVGVVRFNAFDDVGGEQSFAVALLDADDNGVVISSVYSRHDCRTYAKTIQSGTSGHALSDEEMQALGEARSNARKTRESVR